MKTENTDRYHLEELRIALDPRDPQHILPPRLDASQKVLDVGCGVGQTLIAAYPDRLTFGMDADFRALKAGSALTDRISFVCGQAESLPFASGCFDVVMARVSLPYTHINKSLREMRRVLRSGGLLWFTLQRFSVVWRSTQVWSGKRWIYFGYILINSILFHFLGCLIRFPARGYESFQTERGIRRALRAAGFREISIRNGLHFEVTARS